MFRATRLKHEAPYLRIPKLSVSGCCSLVSEQEMPDAPLSVYGAWPLMNSWVRAINAQLHITYDLISISNNHSHYFIKETFLLIDPYNETAEYCVSSFSRPMSNPNPQDVVTLCHHLHDFHRVTKKKSCMDTSQYWSRHLTICINTALSGVQAAVTKVSVSVMRHVFTARLPSADWGRTALSPSQCPSSTRPCPRSHSTRPLIGQLGISQPLIGWPGHMWSHKSCCPKTLTQDTTKSCPHPSLRTLKRWISPKSAKAIMELTKVEWIKL